VVTRRLRILKYRGSTHGTNEYPFLIDDKGISVLPVTSLGLAHAVSAERISSGIPALDEMLGGDGFYRGSSILVTGTAGTGKTSIGAHFIDAACRHGESAVFFAFEEGPEQLIRNMSSIGVDLRQWVKKGLLRIDATRPTTWGLEMHLVRMHKLIRDNRPTVVVMDPLTSLLATTSGDGDIFALVLRIVDYLKSTGATAVFTALEGSGEMERTEIGLSSLVDSWLQLRTLEVNGERNRVLYVLKSRGTAHSNQVREFILTSEGIQLRPVYLGMGGVLTGSARISQEVREREEAAQLKQAVEAKQAELERRLRMLDAQLQGLDLERESLKRELESLAAHERERGRALTLDREALAKSRSSNRAEPRVRASKAGKS
jgi:circadian clock protein KaiC